MHRPLSGQAAAVTVLLAACAAANLAASITASLAPTVRVGMEFGVLLLYLPLVPVFLVWFYRARKNADGRGWDQRHRPGWAIGAWFVPVVWLWFPYQIMADIWRSNLPAEQRKKKARLPGFWWGCWLAGAALGQIGNPLFGPPSAYAPILTGLGELLTAAAAILLILIVRAITRGPVGREPAAAQQRLAPQDGVTGPGLIYPQVPAYDGDGGLAAGAGYALSSLAVVVIAALTAAAIYGLSTTTTHAVPTTHAAPHTSAAAPAPAPQELPAESLEPGDCLRGALGLGTNAPWPDLTMVVPCTEKHMAEVFYSANYWPQSKAFPGNDLMDHQATDKCDMAFIAYDGILNSVSVYSYDYIDPADRQDWRSGDRLLTCVAYEPTVQHPGGEPLYASLRGSGK